MKIHKIETASMSLQKMNNLIYYRKVAAYARVSTSSIEQEASLDAQREYFESYIKAHENWSYVGMYYDNGISGLSHRNRDGFNAMINDALSGKIDLIVTKSLSRFARNTVDALTVIRKLKSAGVEVLFEKENIYTLDSKGEFFLTLISS
ncbi:MAG: recombinase family protein, partial [Oscillospiraceae bacterium]|nr:recombinase family protein [Oscillospiraceae bacterium]